LKNSETVEIITAKTPQPSRDWLSTQTGFLASPRHRNKVRAWFRKLDEPQNKTEEVSAAQAAGATQRLLHAREAPPDHSPVREASVRAPDVEVQGIGDLLSTYARCCKPVPPEPIVGYITVGRGISIHSQACANLARLKLKSPARVLAVDWGKTGRSDFPVDIEVHAFDRRGLVRDVSAALADEKISIQGMTTVTDKRDNIARMRIGISIAGLPQLSNVLARIARVPNVLSARRRK
jgi:GTP pyrophosphokinase